MPDTSPQTDPNRSENREPDPARSYERAKPEKEGGMGRLANDPSSNPQRPDQAGRAVKNAHPPRQTDGERFDAPRAKSKSSAGDTKPGHSMKEEEPLGEDLMPTDIHDPEAKRHPRKEGKGGTR